MFDRAIKRLDQPRPEHYIEHAQLLVATDNPNTERHAVAILDKGAEALGHPISLHSVAVEIEKTSGQLNAALTRIDKVLAGNGSLLNWRLQRSQDLEEQLKAINADTERPNNTAVVRKC